MQYQHSAQHVTKYLDFYRNDIASFIYLSIGTMVLNNVGSVWCISEQWREEIIGLSGENVRRGFHLFDDFVEDSDYQNAS